VQSIVCVSRSQAPAVPPTTMRCLVVIALLFLASTSALEQPAVLGPAGGDASRGETILTAANGNQNSACASPPCGQPTTCASPPCHHVHAPAKPMKPAKVEPSNQACGCMQEPVCGCRQQRTVEPEIRSAPCACIGQANCGCSSSGQVVTAVRDSCGCLQLQVCPCRPKFVAPEVRENHLEPELRENANNNNACGCMQDPVCACRRVQSVTPEIREPRCPCADTQKLECACVGLRSN